MSIKRRIKIGAYTVAKWTGCFRISRWLTRRRVTILCYHAFQYGDEAAFRPVLFMDPALFARRLEYLVKHGYEVIDLERAVPGLADGSLPDNSVVITIDDGFFSVLDLAAPELHKHELPATLYVTSYYVDKGTPVFRLAIQYLFWKTGAREFALPGEPWSPQEPVALSDAQAAHDAMWKIIDFGESECSDEERQEVCGKVAAALDLDYKQMVESRSMSMLTHDEMRELASFGIDVQLHTHRHHFPVETPDAARAELDDNRRVLEAALGSELDHFCYPSGIWSKAAFPILEEKGITSATTCEPGMNDQTTHPLALYRLLDQDNLHDIEFEAELAGFSELLRRVTGRRRATDRLHQR